MTRSNAARRPAGPRHAFDARPRVETSHARMCSRDTRRREEAFGTPFLVVPFLLATYVVGGIIDRIGAFPPESAVELAGRVLGISGLILAAMLAGLFIGLFTFAGACASASWVHHRLGLYACPACGRRLRRLRDDCCYTEPSA